MGGSRNSLEVYVNDFEEMLLSGTERQKSSLLATVCRSRAVWSAE